jgi:hypothetical protein
MTLDAAESEMKKLLQKFGITDQTHKAMFLNLLVSVDDTARKETIDGLLKMARRNG